MITPEALMAKLAQLGELPIVTYVNSPAAVKACSTHLLHVRQCIGYR
jgi:quinolinate synthase